MTDLISKLSQLSANEYREESAKPAIFTMLCIVVIIALPLVWMIRDIGDSGFKAADTTKYSALAESVADHVVAVRNMIENEMVDEHVVIGIASAPMVTLITPEIGPTNSGEAAGIDKGELNVVLKAIYWNPSTPIVTIGTENYKKGEMINGHTIKEIRKTEVLFLSPQGDTVIKYFYDYLEPGAQK